MLTIANLQGKRAHFVKSGNIKLGRMWVWSTLKGGENEMHYIKAFDGYCHGTCGKNCTCCTKQCYVNKSYRYDAVRQCHAVNTIWLLNDLEATFADLDMQLDRARNKPNQVRINQSGELTGVKELLQWILLAKKYDQTQFYVYTKNYDAVDLALETVRTLPQNFTVLISIWHDIGVDTFNRWKSKPNVKAFVYDDGELMIAPTTYCKAYDENGRMNHNITCDKCQKCFNRIGAHKIIGCKAH